MSTEPVQEAGRNPSDGTSRERPDTFADAALLLVGHGSTLDAASGAPVYQQADALRRRGLFAQVLEGFWKLEPSLAGVLRSAWAPRVFVVPIFISEGYFTQEVIPRELGLGGAERSGFACVQRRGAQTIYYCRPVGTHASMTAVLLGRALDTVTRFPFPRAPKPSETALFIAGHGTASHERSREAIESQVRHLRALGQFAEVHPAFLEEAPRIGDCYYLAQARNIVMVPFFISDGWHTRVDIPVLLGEAEAVVQQRLQRGQPAWRNPTERLGKRVWYASAIGGEPHLADVILARVKEGAASTGL